jgi:hypothetical protein
MEISFRPIQHTLDEMIMGQAIWFRPINGIDAISATANVRGFTPLTSIARAYEWARETIDEAAKQCNELGEVAVLDFLQPNLFIVPKTKGQSNTLFYITDLLKAINHMDCETLHFTHYGFIQDKLPSEEIEKILEVMLNPLTQSTLKQVIWDIDLRQDSNMGYLHRVIKQYGLRLSSNA